MLGTVPEQRFSLLGAEHWPPLTIQLLPDPRPEPGNLTHAVPGGVVSYDRATGWARVPAAAEATLEDLVHPNIMIAAYLAAAARDEEAIHAAACAHNGGAWVLLGTHEQGKSTLLAMLAELGCSPLADDMVVIRDRVVCAGARCVDLRPAAAQRLGGGAPARFATRNRIELPPIAAEHPLRGFIHLTWAEPLELVALRPRDRLARLVAQLGHVRRRDRTRLLGLTAVPHWELRRPPDWASAMRSAELVRELMEAP
jgi:hypothetical protein